MFTGSVCAHAREWFKVNSGALAGKRILCGCSGNFTIETVLSQAPEPPAEIISNDISLYSTALGVYYSGAPQLQISVELAEYEFLSEFMNTPLEVAAVMVVMLEVAPFGKRQTAYHVRMADAILNHFADYHSKACEKLQKRKELLSVTEYRAEDVKTFLLNRSEDEIFLSFMPTYSGGYERLYKYLDAVISWPDRPTYDMMDKEGKTALLAKMKEQGNYIHIDDTRRENLGVVGVVHGGHTLPVYIHTDLEGVEPEVYVRSKQKRKRPAIEMLEQNETIESNQLSFVMLNNHEFAWIRDQYLSGRIVAADPSWRFGLCLGQKLIGIIGWSRGKDGVSYYMMCDLPLASKKYKRLSKLVVMAANSKEMLRVLRQQTGRFWNTFQTTAFTARPVSMKYRGVLDLHGRNEKEAKLNYGGTFNGTLKKAVKKWRKLEAKVN